MTTDVLIKIAPLIGGGILLIICLIGIMRSPAVPNIYAGLLAFGALLFVIPTLSNFNFHGLGIEFQGATTGLVTEQAAGIKAQLEDIKTSIADLGKRITPAAAAPAAPSAEYGKNRSSTVIVVYTTDPKTKAIAKQMEDDLLKRGYQATSLFSDYSELGDSKKGPSGSVRFVFTDPALANTVKLMLRPETKGLTVLADDQRAQMSGDVQVLLF
jgi:hypothetical protein